jgi:hypothetical protein
MTSPAKMYLFTFEDEAVRLIFGPKRVKENADNYI